MHNTCLNIRKILYHIIDIVMFVRFFSIKYNNHTVLVESIVACKMFLLYLIHGKVSSIVNSIIIMTLKVIIT